MSNRFMISVAAAALIAGTGFANAQGMNREGGAPAAQQSAPSQSAPSTERGAAPGDRGAAPGAMNRDSGPAGMKGTDSGMKGSESGMKAESGTKAEPGMKADQNEKMPSKSAQDKMDSKSGMKAEGAKDTTKEGTKANGNMNAETKGGMDSKSQTTGNAATSATSAPPAEKRTQIVSTIRSEKIQETTNVNFNISVGAVVPTSVRFHPLPPRIVEIYPEWRGYVVILVSGRYIIVRPQTHEIVYIIEG